MPKSPSSNRNLPPSRANRETKPATPGENTKAPPTAAIVPAAKEQPSAAAPNAFVAQSEPLKNSSASSVGTVAPEGAAGTVIGPRVSIGTALCEAGFDERAVADQYVKVVQSLGKPDSTDRGGATKLLVDVLKECSRQLDNTAGHRAGDAPVVVQLLHTVSRPVRPAHALTSANPPRSIEIAAPPAAGSSADIESTNPSTEPS